MPPKHESHPHHHHHHPHPHHRGSASGKKAPPKSILKNRNRKPQPSPPPAPAPAPAGAPNDPPPPPEEQEDTPPPPLPSRENSPDAAPTIRSNSKRACRLLQRIAADRSPVAAFFGVARPTGPAAALHRLLADEGGRARTGERDVRRIFRGAGGETEGGLRVRDRLLEADGELPGKTVQTKTEFVSINSQFNKIVVTPLEKSFRSHGRSQPDYGHLRKQAELLLAQAREARDALKTAVKDAKRRNAGPDDHDEPDPLQFKIPVQHRKRRKRHSQGRKKF
ncbi:hypothetical protein SLS58_002954 [Diplodia intermedia]|uniref:Uncharacterized protein n=1 Tax=Diplodia intermedia TaxID=856260 RepID=A0ABR3TY49_9PEZI